MPDDYLCCDHLTNAGPLEEQPVLLTAESALQPLVWVFKTVLYGQDNLELLILLFLPPERWDYKCALPCSDLL